MRPWLAEDIMNPDILTVRKDMLVRDLALFLTEKEISGAPVVDEAGAVHRTTPSGRTVNLLIERADVTTTFEGGDGSSRNGSGAQAQKG